MASLDYPKAARLLNTLFIKAQQAFQTKHPPEVQVLIRRATDALFSSSTQSYREVLLFPT